MKLIRIKIILLGLLFLTFFSTGNIFAQNEESSEKSVNFPYSKNPKTTSPKKEKKEEKTDKNSENTKNGVGSPENSENTKIAKNENLNPETEKKDKELKTQKNKVTKVEPNTIETAENSEKETKNSDLTKTDQAGLSEEETKESFPLISRSIANKTLEVAERESKKAILPTEIYKVGVGDILFISLQNASPNVSTYFTVLNNGAIDYPLAGGMNFVLGLTPEEIETELRKNIKLYENPQISVKVREHSSHSITVLGLVEKPGIKYLQREAVPLYVIRAEAITQSRANHIAIRRAENEETEQYSLLDPKSDEVLVFPGDIVEFSSVLAPKEETKNPQFYYIGGNVNSVGQKDFYPGITLTQAILASGGLTREKVKVVVIRRKDENGLLVSSIFDLNKIKDGKVPDPVLQAGDTIEVEN